MVQGWAEWPGITSEIISASYTCSHGISPGLISARVRPLDLAKVPKFGTFRFTDGGRFRLDLKNVKMVPQSMSIGGQMELSVMFLDRRWRWQFPRIEGAYNVRKPNGDIDELTIESPTILIQKCLDALGETNYKLGEIPTPASVDLLPEVVWQQESAAGALASLCDRFGLRVVYQPFQDRVLIERAGKGKQLPDGFIIRQSLSIEAPRAASKIVVRSRPNIYQIAIPLEPVCREPDGRFVPNDDASYKPKNGWGNSIPPFGMNLQIPERRLESAANLLVPGIRLQPLDKTEYRSLALACLWRTYRIRLVDPETGGDFYVPGVKDPIKDISQIVLLEGLAQPKGGFDTIDLDPPRLYGAWANGRTGTTPDKPNTLREKRIEVNFSIDAAAGIITLDRPVFRHYPKGATLEKTPTALPIKEGEIGAADLILLISCMVREFDTRAFIRFEHAKDLPIPKGQQVPAKNDPAYVQLQDDLQVVYQSEYDPKTWALSKVKDDTDEAKKQAAYYADAIAKSWDSDGQGINNSYGGLLRIEPDGMIQQVSWSVGGQISTTASSNSEHSEIIEPYPARRRREKLRIFFGDS